MTVVTFSTAGPWCSGTPEQVRADTDIREQQSCSWFAAAPATSRDRVVAMKRDRNCLLRRWAMRQHSGLTEVCSVRWKANRRVTNMSVCITLKSLLLHGDAASLKWWVHAAAYMMLTARLHRQSWWSSWRIFNSKMLRLQQHCRFPVTLVYGRSSAVSCMPVHSSEDFRRHHLC